MPRAGLSQQRVVAKAADVADEVGFEQLTLAAVAARFGVRLPSLYKHVDGLQGLRRHVTLLALRELGAVIQRAAVGRAGSDALAAVAHSYRRYAHAHPGRYAATLRAPSKGDEQLQAASAAILDVVFAVLAGYGLRGTDAIDATRTLRSALHGFASLETAGGFGMRRNVNRSFERLIGALDAAFKGAVRAGGERRSR